MVISKYNTKLKNIGIICLVPFSRDELSTLVCWSACPFTWPTIWYQIDINFNVILFYKKGWLWYVAFIAVILSLMHAYTFTTIIILARELLELSSQSTQGEIILMFLTILLYFCTSILTVLYFIKDCSFKAPTKCMSSVLSPFFIHFGTALKLQYYTSILLYFYTHLYYLVKYKSFWAITWCMNSGLSPLLVYFFEL